jgi:purine-binding chemotaxis protein CheW
MPKSEREKMEPQRRSEGGEIALYEEDLYEKAELKEETIQLVVFRLAREWYGVEITKVKEVIKVEKITYIPSSPEHIAGIINLRGNVLSVTDLKRIFALPHEELTEKTRIVAIESGIVETGLLVDEVAEAIEVPVSKIEPTLSTIAPEMAEYIEGQCRVNGKLIALLNGEKILERRV